MKFTIKKFIGFSLLLVAVIGVIIFKPFVLQAEVTQATRDYLHAQALSDWVVMGLAATGENNFNLDYLVQANPQSATDYSRSILAITAANQNPMTVANRDWLTGLRGFFNNNQFGSIQLINDDIWAVLALHAAGTANDDNQLVAAKNFILANQNQEGGWSYRIGLGSDSNNTAAALMALAATGLGVNDQAVSRGLRYLRDMQGVDGGFPYQAGSDSDGASTAWVMAGLQSLNQDLAAWTREGHTAASFLQTLVLANGSYRWQLGDQEGDLITTAYAAVALSNHFYPVRLWQNPNQPQPAPQVSLRIESPSSTICQMTVSATSVLAALLNGAETCGYTVHITNSALGSYVSGINNWQAGGTEGWSYRVNWQYSRLSADQQAVQQNDQVLWFFGNGDD
ncbi:MAG: DUF4430 domain-containing protein, partial [Candidatus Komeilibacteria bacterium]|nr:DUF4430 domain-containing protein [Candidatus Komeilibacteria bacterium]